LTFTNLTTGGTFSTKSNGAVAHKRFNSDGSFTETDTGHNILILFPTDVPARAVDDADRGSCRLHGRHQRSLHPARRERKDDRYLRSLVLMISERQKKNE